MLHIGLEMHLVRSAFCHWELAHGRLEEGRVAKGLHNLGNTYPVALVALRRAIWVFIPKQRIYSGTHIQTLVM